jgi:hypothetical protein
LYFAVAKADLITQNLRMREVNPNMTGPHIDFKKILETLIAFIKNPVEQISKIPDWNWPSLFFVQVAIAIASGLLAGLIKLNIYRMAAGIFIMPFVSTITALLMTTFFYYYFQFFENRTENFRRIFTFVILSSIPFYIFQIISEYFAPITLIGFGFSFLLAIIGLHDNFKVEKKRCYQLMGILFSLVLVTWITSRYSN